MSIMYIFKSFFWRPSQTMYATERQIARRHLLFGRRQTISVACVTKVWQKFISLDYFSSCGVLYFSNVVNSVPQLCGFWSWWIVQLNSALNHHAECLSNAKYKLIYLVYNLQDHILWKIVFLQRVKFNFDFKNQSIYKEINHWQTSRIWALNKSEASILTPVRVIARSFLHCYMKKRIFWGFYFIQLRH